MVPVAGKYVKTTFSTATAKVLVGPSGVYTAAQIPDACQYILVQAETQDIRWRDDGTAPTANTGNLLKANTAMYVDRGQFQAIQFVEVTSGAVLHTQPYKG